MIHELLRRRSDGPWEWLATAAGDLASLARSLAAIDGEVMEQGFDGPASSPSVVEARIEAIAAFDPGLLVGPSRTWRSPAVLGIDIMDSIADFHAVAWMTSMRFVGVPDGARDCRYLGIRQEAEVLDAPAGAGRTWREVLDLTYSQARALDRTPIEGDDGVLHDRLGNDAILRLLRERTRSLSPALLRAAVARFDREPARLAQVVAAAGVAVDLEPLIRAATRPADLASIVYPFLGAGWRSR